MKRYCGVKDNLLKHLFFSKIFVPLRATHAMRKGNGDVLLTMLHNIIQFLTKADEDRP